MANQLGRHARTILALLEERGPTLASWMPALVGFEGDPRVIRTTVRRLVASGTVVSDVPALGDWDGVEAFVAQVFWATPYSAPQVAVRAVTHQDTRVLRLPTQQPLGLHRLVPVWMGGYAQMGLAESAGFEWLMTEESARPSPHYVLAEHLDWESGMWFVPEDWPAQVPVRAARGEVTEPLPAEWRSPVTGAEAARARKAARLAIASRVAVHRAEHLEWAAAEVRRAAPGAELDLSWEASVRAPSLPSPAVESELAALAAAADVFPQAEIEAEGTVQEQERDLFPQEGHGDEGTHLNPAA